MTPEAQPEHLQQQTAIATVTDGPHAYSQQRAFDGVLDLCTRH